VGLWSSGRTNPQPIPRTTVRGLGCASFPWSACAPIPPGMQLTISGLLESPDAVFEHYTCLNAQLQRKTEAPESTPAPTGKTPAAVPSAGESSSAPGIGAAELTHVPPGTTADEAREALVQEAVSLGLPEAEVRRVVTMHKDLEKARSILTNAARKKVQAA
jgi:hypothetical protein